MQPNKFVITLTEHRVFGHMLAPYLVVKNDEGTFYRIVSPVLKRDVDTPGNTFAPEQVQIVTLIENYSDEHLAKKFSRGQSVVEFFQNVDKNYFNKFVSPYIDKQIVKCLELMKEHNIPLYSKRPKYSNLYDEDQIHLLNVETEATFHFDLTHDGLTYTLKVWHNGAPLNLFMQKAYMVADTPCRMVMGNSLYSFDRISWKKLFPFFEKEVVNVPQSAIDKYMKSYVYNTIRDNNVEASGFDIVSVEAEKKAIVSVERGLDYAPMLTLKFQYGTKKFMAGQEGLVEVEFHHEKGRYIFYKHSRDKKWEKEQISFLRSLGVKLNASQLVLTREMNPYGDELRFITINWLNKNREELREQEIGVEQNMDIEKYFTGLQHIEFDMKSERDWFDLYAIVTFGEFKIPFIKLKNHILQGIREFKLPNGEVAILPIEWFSRYHNLFAFAQHKNDSMRFSKFHFTLLLEQDFDLGEKVSTEMALIDPLNFEAEKVPDGLNATLRDYQRLGFSWMAFLGKNHFGGCLADDMGLGKTLQTIALLLKLKKKQKLSPSSKQSDAYQISLFPVEEETVCHASLIVLPTSLVHNWKNEISKFAPSLKVYVHVGPNRRKPSELGEIIGTCDVVLTTYGTIRNDYEQMEGTVFNYLILDESQTIKNPESKGYLAVCGLQSEFRLALTGTPIENSLSDLWAQLNFLNPGLLGNFNFFKDEFIVPIEKRNDEEKQKQLQQIILPFILRRTKEEVANDLPSLTEQVVYCEMTESQRKIYEEQKSIIRNSILENIEKNGIGKSAFVVLQALTKLRQLANHPIMVGENETGSGKFDEVAERLHSLVAERHKVLIFSSFVKHLELFRTEIEAQGWKYSMLTGQTRERETVIRSFQEDRENLIFLISLKAGGVGLNLTSADYIFILDPWWNPAVEAQAVSRAHRIGQDKKVFVYRFITEESIEEKIQAMKEKKRELAKMFVETTNPFKAFSDKEILELFD